MEKTIILEELMKQVEIFSRNDEICSSYFSKIRESMQSGNQDVAEFSDGLCQFLCDASDKVLLRAKKIEELGEKYPNINEFFKLAERFRRYSQMYKETYVKLERLQMEGKVPTNLESANTLLESL